MLWGFQTVALFFLEASSLLRAQTGSSHLLYNLLVITEIPDSLSPIRRNDPGVNHRLITITKQCLIPMICLSLHPIRETLPSLLLPPAALCPLFNSAERPGTRGEQIDLLRGPYWQCLCCCSQCQALALHAGWLSGVGTTTCRLIRSCFYWQTPSHVCWFFCIHISFIMSLKAISEIQNFL